MLEDLEKTRVLTDTRKEVIGLLQQEPYLKADHDFDSVKFRLRQLTDKGVELVIRFDADTLMFDLVVLFNMDGKDKEYAYDYCSGLANEIFDERTDASRYDHNELPDGLVFHYSLNLNKSQPQEIIKQLRRAIEAC